MIMKNRLTIIINDHLFYVSQSNLNDLNAKLFALWTLLDIWWSKVSPLPLITHTSHSFSYHNLQGPHRDFSYLSASVHIYFFLWLMSMRHKPIPRFVDNIDIIGKEEDLRFQDHIDQCVFYRWRGLLTSIRKTYEYHSKPHSRKIIHHLQWISAYNHVETKLCHHVMLKAYKI